ncbi:MAG: M3 family metallopeptidase [Psychroflexus sp.]|nr:M3 family metallopeptidase [Psychroflexus sp.]MDR9448069.1 M3 family metallopeptidase [Psychroflexus sp.]
MSTDKDNPLLKDFDQAPFSKISIADFEAAFQHYINETQQEILRIANQTAYPDFENTIEALEFSGQRLERVAQIFFNLNSAETNAEIQTLAQKISPELSKLNNDITLNENLFQRVKTVYNHRHQLDLSTEQYRLLDMHYQNFARNGANLNKQHQEKLRAIDQELAKLSLTFGENVLAETNEFQWYITDKNQLEGLPDYVVENAKSKAEEQDLSGYILTLDFPTYFPVMKYAKNRNLRKKIALAFGARGFNNNDHNNESIVKRISQLRYDRAQLLGYQHHADYVLERRMANSLSKVNQFLDDLLDKALPVAQDQLKEVETFAYKKDNINQLQKWDLHFYSEQLKKQKFDFDEQKIKAYFELNKVICGMFTIANQLYGLSFQENKHVDKYHEEVITYDVLDENSNLKALFYLDLHPRSGKRDGAWMTIYKNQYKKAGVNQRPHVSIVCNFTRPSKHEPSLLTFTEVTTLFHEFGHALHAMHANTVYPSLSGASVYWDFVELPSQLMENWCYEKEALHQFAEHYQTQEKLPEDELQKIKASANFLEGIQTLRQVSFAKLDMGWHAINPYEVEDVKKHEANIFEPMRLLPDVPENCMSTAFGHVFQGGYSSGYYSYKWAEVLDADAFAYFKEKGIFNPEVAHKFKQNVLEQGGTEDPMTLYKNFRGKEPQIDALLKRAGLVRD